MKEFDPTLQITCSGTHGGSKADVTPYLLETAGEYLDLVSIHNYWLDRGRALPRYDYMTAITKSEMPEAYVSGAIRSLDESGLGDHLKVAFDEWNLRAWQHPGFPRDRVENYDDPEVRGLVEQRVRENDLAEQYTMADALFSASFLNSCLRHSDRVVMANVAPLVNTRGPLFVHPKGIVRRTHFHAMAMYANLLEARVVEVDVASDKLTHGDESVATIDAIATVDDSGKTWAIALVNRHPSEEVACPVSMKGAPLDGTFNSTILAGDSPDAYNDIEHPNRVAPVKTQLAFDKGVVKLPPHSLTIVKVLLE
jgi:alpha-N-arabinofuranosidase